MISDIFTLALGTPVSHPRRRRPESTRITNHHTYYASAKPAFLAIKQMDVIGASFLIFFMLVGSSFTALDFIGAKRKHV